MAKYETKISSNIKPFDLNLKETFSYWDLIVLFVKKNFSLIYKQTVLGPIWIVIQPLASSILFTVVFGQMVGIETDGIPQLLFYISGTSLWTMFTSCLNGISNTFMSNNYLFSKVYFPRLTIPISNAISSLMKFAIQFVMIVVFYIYYAATGVQFTLNWMVLLVPILLIQTVLLAMGVGIIVSSLTIKYRDLSLAIGLIVQLWMYASPIVYPLSKASGILRTILLCNPVTPIVNNFRYCMFGCGEFLTGSWLVSIAVTAVLLVLGIALFNKTERNFVDVI